MVFFEVPMRQRSPAFRDRALFVIGTEPGAWPKKNPPLGGFQAEAVVGAEIGLEAYNLG